MLIVQDPTRPNVVLEAITELAGPATTRFRAMVAYTTLGGVDILTTALESAVGPGWAELPRTLITCFDYGLTEPDALSWLLELGFDVRVANVGDGSVISLQPAGSAFHPKLYLFDTDAGVSAAIGSANLTRRAMTVNVEAMSVVHDADDVDGINRLWQATVRGAQSLTDELLAIYREVRPSALRIPTSAKEPVPPKPLPAAGGFRVFWEAVNDGSVDPRAFAAFWIEAGSMSSSGSHAQLELPRRACRFFGYDFDDYDDHHHVIGLPPLFAAGELFTDRPLTWHGNNMMERLNLPTFEQSGLRYPGTAIMFRRDEDAFQIEVKPWDSPATMTWRAESAASGNQFRLGRNSNRVCGLL